MTEKITNLFLSDLDKYLAVCYLISFRDENFEYSFKSPAYDKHKNKLPRSSLELHATVGYKKLILETKELY